MTMDGSITGKIIVFFFSKLLKLALLAFLYWFIFRIHHKCWKNCNRSYLIGSYLQMIYIKIYREMTTMPTKGVSSKLLSVGIQQLVQCYTENCWQRSPLSYMQFFDQWDIDKSIFSQNIFLAVIFSNRRRQWKPSQLRLCQRRAPITQPWTAVNHHY